MQAAFSRPLMSEATVQMAPLTLSPSDPYGYFALLLPKLTQATCMEVTAYFNRYGGFEMAAINHHLIRLRNGAPASRYCTAHSQVAFLTN